MIDVVYVTGNANKAKYFNQMVGLDIPHQPADLDELQSLDLEEIIEHKVRQAYKILKKPVIVEDTKLVFAAYGRLPGPLIKWFIEEIGLDGLCGMVTGKDTRAFAGAAIAYFDGTNLKIFQSELAGTITTEPRGDNGFGWNGIFMPGDEMRTLGELSDDEFKQWYGKIKPFAAVREYLLALDEQ